MLVTEANIRRGHCGSFLCNTDSADHYRVRLFSEKQAMDKELREHKSSFIVFYILRAW